MATKTGYYIIYKATAPSGKLYIGFTHYRLSDRIWQHYSDARKGVKRPFCSALRKYGNKIKWEIIACYQNMEFALNRETYFIKKFDTYNSPKGYNCTKGGEGCPGAVYLNRRTRIIDNNGNIYLGISEIVEKLELKYTNVVNAIKFAYWCKGYYFSKYKEGMIKAVEPKTSPKRQRKVLNLHTGVVFESMREAAKSINTIEQDIQRVCTGRRYLAKGQPFCYLEDAKLRIEKIKNNNRYKGPSLIDIDGGGL
jgi:predicted GIY-YIG superfamily endonuclease